MSLEIGRLVLDIPGLDPAQARALGERVAARLAGLELSGSVDRLSISAPAGAGPDHLAGLVAAQVRARLGGA